MYICRYILLWCGMESRDSGPTRGGRAATGTAHALAHTVPRDGQIPDAEGQPPHTDRTTMTRRRGDASCRVVPRTAHGHAGRTVLRANQQPPGTGTTAPFRAPLILSKIAHFAPQDHRGSARRPAWGMLAGPAAMATRSPLDAHSCRAQHARTLSRGIGLQTSPDHHCMHRPTQLLL